MKTREEQIGERRAQMPRAYRGIYDKAMTGKSRKAAMRAFCLECVAWQVNEVFSCTDVACPLYPYRPASRAAQSVPQDSAAAPETIHRQRKGPA
jgi:hypothetical protein